MTQTEQDSAKTDLYTALDGLHGQVLRAKHRLTKSPDRDILADLIADIVGAAKHTETLWQAYDADAAR